jgi:hypothetical protein
MSLFTLILCHQKNTLVLIFFLALPKFKPSHILDCWMKVLGKLKHTAQPNITICKIEKINNSKRLVKPSHILDLCIVENYNIIDKIMNWK